MNILLTPLTVRQWITGILGSWLVVWFLGPLVLDSILIRTYDPALNVNTLRPGDVVHWRSEGWGRTVIGPHGLPGWQPRVDDDEANSDNPSISKVVIWGDSQVEGVCVDDRLKIHNQAIRIAQDEHQLAIDCLPMGRSGADARDWQDLIADADKLWNPDLHIWVVTDLSDLTVAVSPDAAANYRRWTVESPAWVKFAKQIQAQALFAASKRIFRDPDTGEIRRFDFSLGPRTHDSIANLTTDESEVLANNEQTAIALADLLSKLSTSYDGRIAILYAPATPRFSGGLVTDHPDDAAFDSIREALESKGIAVGDCRYAFIDLWQSQGKIARGFNNGMPTYGHLNADGNRVVAEKIVAMLSTSRKVVQRNKVVGTLRRAVTSRRHGGACLLPYAEKTVAMLQERLKR